MRELYNERLNEKIIMGESEGGIKVYFIPKKGFTKQYAIFSTKYGSIDNKFKPIGEDEIIEVPEGIAHFLEHKLFEDPTRDIFDEYSKIGADVNAFTSFNQTSYVFSSDKNFYEGLELLVDFVQNPYLTDENVEKEKGIIAQEIKMYDDDPGWKVFFNLLNALYTNHPVRIDIAGTVDTIAEIDKDILYRTYNTFYHPSNMVLSIVGDLEFDKIMETINKSEKIFETQEELVRGDFIEDDAINTNRIVEEMVVPTPIFYIGFKERDLNYNGEKLIKRNIVTDLLLDCLFASSGNFYNDLYNEGLIDLSFGASYTGEETYGHSVILGQSKDPDEVNRRILEYIKKPLVDIVDEDTFTRLKNKLIGRYIMLFDYIEGIGNNFVDLYFNDFSIFDYLSLLESINYEDIEKRYDEHLLEEFSAISIINPIKGGE